MFILKKKSCQAAVAPTGPHILLPAPPSSSEGSSPQAGPREPASEALGGRRSPGRLLSHSSLRGRSGDVASSRQLKQWKVMSLKNRQGNQGGVFQVTALPAQPGQPWSFFPTVPAVGRGGRNCSPDQAEPARSVPEVTHQERLCRLGVCPAPHSPAHCRTHSLVTIQTHTSQRAVQLTHCQKRTRVTTSFAGLLICTLISWL